MTRGAAVVDGAPHGAGALRPVAEAAMTLEADYLFIHNPARRALALHSFTPEWVVAEPDSDAAAGPAVPAMCLAQPLIRFWDFPSSPFCIKVRAMLLHKGLAFQALDPLQPRAWIELQRRGTGKVPALEIDGERVGDSTEIAHRLDLLAPQPALLPADSRQRALCHALEEWADESIYFVGLHYLWRHPASAGQVAALFGRGPLGRLAYAWYRLLIERQLRGQGTGRKSPQQIAVELERHLDHAQALLQGPQPFLLGDRPWLCDFALFGQLAFLLRARASRAAMLARPALVSYVDRMRWRALSQRGHAAPKRRRA